MPSASGPKRLILGSEHDETLRSCVIAVLRGLKAQTRASTWGMGGSQEVGIYRFTVDGEDIVITSETYAGLAIEGSAALVDKIQAQVQAMLSLDEAPDSGPG